jgi:hypothetical protein
MTTRRPLSDSELEALLRALPRHAPSAGFADRVLARVPCAAPVPWWRRIPWRALTGLLTLEVGLVAVFVWRFRDDLASLPGRMLDGFTTALIAVQTVELTTVVREFVLSLVPRVGAVIGIRAAPSAALLLGALGTLFGISLLGRGMRASTSRR